MRCLLNTSEAADDHPWVDSGGRRFMKKKSINCCVIVRAFVSFELLVAFV